MVDSETKTRPNVRLNHFLSAPVSALVAIKVTFFKKENILNERFLPALDNVKISLISRTGQKGRINSAATVTTGVTCANAHFHDNLIRRSAEAILSRRAGSVILHQSERD